MENAGEDRGDHGDEDHGKRRNHVPCGLEQGVVEDNGPHLDGQHVPDGEAARREFRLEKGEAPSHDDRVDIAARDVRGVRVLAVDKERDIGPGQGRKVFCETGRDDEGQLRRACVEAGAAVGLAFGVAGKAEQPVVEQVLDERHALRRIASVKDCDGDVLHLGREGVAEHEHLHEHGQNNEPDRERVRADL